MILHLLRTVRLLKPDAVAVVTGHEAKQVEAALKPQAPLFKKLELICQTRQMGTGHAVTCAQNFIRCFEEIMILCADTPLLGFESLWQLLQIFRNQKYQVALLTARLLNPRGYGRVIRGATGDILKIVEELEASPKELNTHEINTGAYCFQSPSLLNICKTLTSSGAKKEYYLTDAVQLLRSQGGRIGAWICPNADEILGINSLIQLAQAERILSRRTLENLMRIGVTILDPMQTYVDSTVLVEPDTLLYPGTILKGNSKIASHCQIGPFSFLENTQVGPHSVVLYSVAVEARIADHAIIGPFSHLRQGSSIGSYSKIGNFTEIKASRIGRATKVPHLAYIGDAELEEEINVGAGTITCNYDGQQKHKTIIRAKSFIGSNVNLVAPVTIGHHAVIGAGSTITEDVPPETLAIARPRQIHKPKKK